MRRFVKDMAIGLALLMQSGSLAAGADVTLNALYMKQAAYSEDDVRAMTSDFEAGQSGNQGQSGIRALRGAARQDRRGAGRRLVGLRRRAVRRHLAGRVRHQGFPAGRDRAIPADETAKIFDGAWTTVHYDGKR